MPWTFSTHLEFTTNVMHIVHTFIRRSSKCAFHIWHAPNTDWTHITPALCMCVVCCVFVIFTIIALQYIVTGWRPVNRGLHVLEMPCHTHSDTQAHTQHAALNMAHGAASKPAIVVLAATVPPLSLCDAHGDTSLLSGAKHIAAAPRNPLCVGLYICTHIQPTQKKDELQMRFARIAAKRNGVNGTKVYLHAQRNQFCIFGQTSSI